MRGKVMAAVAEAPRTQLTAEEALEWAGDGRWELVRGEVQEMPPAGWEHGVRSASLGHYLWTHARQHDLGQVLTNDPGFLIARNPDTIRAPDIAFIPKSKVPETLPKGWITVVPDLVVEVISPNDRWSKVQDKIADWLRFGVRLVWVVDPELRTISVYRPDQPLRVLTEQDTLEGEEIVPGFSLPVREVFA
jgi:Uma2 family endonuclease